MALTGKNVAAGAAGLVSDSFGGITGNLPTDAAEIAANPSLVKDAVALHNPTTDFQKAAEYSPGTYVAAKDPVYGVPLAFAVVGGKDNTPATQQLFGSQGSGYGGISAGGGSAGAAGYRDTPGTWTSAGFQRTS